MFIHERDYFLEGVVPPVISIIGENASSRLQEYNPTIYLLKDNRIYPVWDSDREFCMIVQQLAEKKIDSNIKSLFIVCIGGGLDLSLLTDLFNLDPGKIWGSNLTEAEFYALYDLSPALYQKVRPVIGGIERLKDLTVRKPELSFDLISALRSVSSLDTRDPVVFEHFFEYANRLQHDGGYLFVSLFTPNMEPFLQKRLKHTRPRFFQKEEAETLIIDSGYKTIAYSSYNHQAALNQRFHTEADFTDQPTHHIFLCQKTGPPNKLAYDRKNGWLNIRMRISEEDISMAF